jgi:hypothetical protein
VLYASERLDGTRTTCEDTHVAGYDQVCVIQVRKNYMWGTWTIHKCTARLLQKKIVEEESIRRYWYW